MFHRFPEIYRMFPSFQYLSRRIAGHRSPRPRRLHGGSRQQGFRLTRRRRPQEVMGIFHIDQACSIHLQYIYNITYIYIHNIYIYPWYIYTLINQISLDHVECVFLFAKFRHPLIKVLGWPCDVLGISQAIRHWPAKHRRCIRGFLKMVLLQTIQVITSFWSWHL
jgi:hypothetical protein